jgi:iron complex outermembrane receptor protein
VNLPINDAMAFRASVQGQHRDNWVEDPVRNEKFGGYNDWAARLQLLFKPGDTFSALFNVHGRYLTGSSTLFRANIVGPGTSSLVPGFDPATMYADGPNDSKLTTIGANVHLTWSLPMVTLQSITGYESVQKYFALGDIDGGCGDTFGAQNAACASALPVNFIGNHAGPGVIPFAVETSAGLPNHYQLTQEFRAVSKNEGPLTGQAGLFFFYEDVTAADDDYCAPDGCVASAPLFALQDTLVSRQKNNAEAIFASLDYKPVEPFTATAGIRLTEDHRSIDSHFTPFIPGLFSPAPNAPIEPLSASKTAGNVSWDISGNYKLSPDVSLYARVATGFRAPTLGEAGFGSSVQVVRSENIISYEGGFKADLFEHRARLSLDGFYYDVKNQQISAVGGATNTTILLNAKDTIGYGSELDFEAHPMPNLTFNFSGSMNFTRIDDPGLTVAVGGGVPPADILNPSTSLPGPFGPVYYAQINGNPLPQAAKYVFDTSLRYEFPLSTGGKLYVYTDWSYRSSINFFLYESKDFDAPSMTQGGLRLGYTWSDGKYDVAAFCRNCTNQIRTVGGIDFNNLTGYINDPRIVGGQFRVRF